MNSPPAAPGLQNAVLCCFHGNQQYLGWGHSTAEVLDAWQAGDTVLQADFLISSHITMADWNNINPTIIIMGLFSCLQATKGIGEKRGNQKIYRGVFTAAVSIRGSSGYVFWKTMTFPRGLLKYLKLQWSQLCTDVYSYQELLQKLCCCGTQQSTCLQFISFSYWKCISISLSPWKILAQQEENSIVYLENLFCKNISVYLPTQWENMTLKKEVSCWQRVGEVGISQIFSSQVILGNSFPFSHFPHFSMEFSIQKNPVVFPP